MSLDIRLTAVRPTTVFELNVTHNLNRMADAAGLYKYMWRPDEIGIQHAGDLIIPLQAGLALLKANPEKFKAFNPSNRWGDYDGFVRVVEEYLEACKQNPDAEIYCSR